MRCVITFALTFATLFTPVIASAKDAEEIVIGKASGRELIALLTDNTLFALPLDQADNEYGYLYLKRDGTANFRDMLLDAEPERMRWSVDKFERLCLTEDLGPDQRRDCVLLRVVGDELYIYTDNGNVEHHKARLLRGEPREWTGQ